MYPNFLNSYQICISPVRDVPQNMSRHSDESIIVGKIWPEVTFLWSVTKSTEKKIYVLISRSASQPFQLTPLIKWNNLLHHVLCPIESLGKEARNFLLDAHPVRQDILERHPLRPESVPQGKIIPRR